MSQPVAGTSRVASSDPTLVHSSSPVRLVAWPQVGFVNSSGVEAAQATTPTTITKATTIAAITTPAVTREPKRQTRKKARPTTAADGPV